MARSRDVRGCVLATRPRPSPEARRRPTDLDLDADLDLDRDLVCLGMFDRKAVQRFAFQKHAHVLSKAND